MSAIEEPLFALRRIVVAVDSSSCAEAAVRAASRLAARFRARVEGLFVEDVELVNLAGLPLGRIVSVSGHARAFDAQTLQEHFRSESSRARRALESAAGVTGVQCSFRVSRGRVAVQILDAAAGADLLVMGIASRRLGEPGRPGSAALAAAAGAPGPVLLLRPGTESEGTPMVCLEDSATVRKALAVAAGLTGEGCDLAVLVAAQDAAAGEQLRREAALRLRAQGVGFHFVESEGSVDAARLCRLARAAGADVLVLGADNAAARGDEALTLLRQVSCPLLLVR